MHTDTEDLNGNGHGPQKFGIVPKEDPILAHTAPKARRRVLLDTLVPAGARMFFCYLIDCALWTGVASSAGVVRFVNSTLAGRFGVDEKTIQNWKNFLRAAGYIWTTEKMMKNCYPETVYHITALVGERPPMMAIETEDGSLPDDEISTNRRRFKNSERDPETGKFARRGSKTAQPLNRVFSAENSDSQHPTEKILPVSTETNCRVQRQTDAVGNGNKMPVGTETDCRGERQTVAAEDGKSLPPTTENGCRDARKKSAGTKESLVRDKRLFNNVHGSKRFKNGAQKAEAELLSRVYSVMADYDRGFAKRELKDSGGFWRTAYRTDADKIERVLNEVHRMIKEKEPFSKNPGATAVDLFNRWPSHKTTTATTPAPAKKTKAAHVDTPQTEAEMVEIAIGLQSIGKIHLCSAEQRAALKRAEARP
jgi:hypothetical protein